MALNKAKRGQLILDYLTRNPDSASSAIREGLNISRSLVTLKRLLTELVNQQKLIVRGGGRSTRYIVNPAYKLFTPIDIEKYFEHEVDARDITDRFNPDLINNIASAHELFDIAELEKLNALQATFTENINAMSDVLKKKGFETLAIDLSWKSSEIEGNTYTLLETEQLLKEAKEAPGKRADEAVMLLNHKRVTDYIMDDPGYINPLTRAKLEDMHKMLIDGLGVNPGLRERGVAIGGTNYRPLDNQFQIQEAVEDVCTLINGRTNVFDKALLALLLVSYVQPFDDGNKRTARLTSNALLLAEEHCPLSFRTVDSQDYKKAMLLFYEQNSLMAFKQLFIEQYEFAVTTYF